jgi:hypothetical protein
MTYRFRMQPGIFALAPNLPSGSFIRITRSPEFFLAEGALIGVLLVESSNAGWRSVITDVLHLTSVSAISTTLSDCPRKASIER